MKIYYTTSLDTGQGTLDPSDSIGGYKSNVIVRNGDIGGLFGVISLFAISQNKAEYRAIMIENDSNETIKNVTLSLIKPESALGILSIAPVSVGKSNTGVPVMERVANIFSKPFVGEFISPTGEEKINIGDIPSLGCVGIWIRREIDQSVAKTEYYDVARPTQEKPYWYESVEKQRNEVWQLDIEWDD